MGCNPFPPFAITKIQQKFAISKFIYKQKRLFCLQSLSKFNRLAYKSKAKQSKPLTI